jgi:hypothetical protein
MGNERAAVLFTSSFQETKSGASLILKAKNAADIEKLQTNTAGKIAVMNQGKSCHLLASVN